jgi:hypothetical protein
MNLVENASKWYHFWDLETSGLQVVANHLFDWLKAKIQIAHVHSNTCFKHRKHSDRYACKHIIRSSSLVEIAVLCLDPSGAVGTWCNALLIFNLLTNIARCDLMRYGSYEETSMLSSSSTPSLSSSLGLDLGLKSEFEDGDVSPSSTSPSSSIASTLSPTSLTVHKHVASGDNLHC